MRAAPWPNVSDMVYAVPQQHESRQSGRSDLHFGDLGFPGQLFSRQPAAGHAVEQAAHWTANTTYSRPIPIHPTRRDETEGPGTRRDDASSLHQTSGQLLLPGGGVLLDFPRNAATPRLRSLRPTPTALVSFLPQVLLRCASRPTFGLELIGRLLQRRLLGRLPSGCRT